jgi:hypothetical protein
MIPIRRNFIPVLIPEVIPISITCVPAQEIQDIYPGKPVIFRFHMQVKPLLADMFMYGEHQFLLKINYFLASPAADIFRDPGMGLFHNIDNILFEDPE